MNNTLDPGRGSVTDYFKGANFRDFATIFRGDTPQFMGEIEDIGRSDSYLDLFLHPVHSIVLFEHLIPYLEVEEMQGRRDLRERDYIQMRLDDLEKISWQHQEKLREYGSRLDKLEERASPAHSIVSLITPPLSAPEPKITEHTEIIPVKRAQNVTSETSEPAIIKIGKFTITRHAENSKELDPLSLFRKQSYGDMFRFQQK